ncbi:MAG: DAK2 domain-containing protein, partial [Dehalococcoidia bacterium]
EVTKAVRSSRVNGLRISKGDAIGLLDGQLLASCRGPAEVVRSLAERCGSRDYSLATVYYGAAATEADRQGVVGSLKGCFAGVEVEEVDGGQPDYDFIISLE